MPLADYYRYLRLDEREPNVIATALDARHRRIERLLKRHRNRTVAKDLRIAYVHAKNDDDTCSREFVVVCLFVLSLSWQKCSILV